jgi:hypothetical protein
MATKYYYIWYRIYSVGVTCAAIFTNINRSIPYHNFHAQTFADRILDVSSINNIELHAPTSSTQKLKLMRKGEQFTYTPTLPLTCRLPQAAYVDIGVAVLF